MTLSVLSILKRHPGKIALFVIIFAVCFAIFINRDSIFSGPAAAGPAAAGPAAAGPAAAGVVEPSITFGDVDLILNPDSDGGVEAYQVEYASETKTDLGRNIDIGLNWTNGIGFTDFVTKITIERAFGDGSTDIIVPGGGIGTKDGELVNIIIKGENIPDGQNVVGTNTFKVKYHTAVPSVNGFLGTASVEILESHLDKTITISDVMTLSFDPNFKEELVASLDNVDFTRYDLSLKNSDALGNYFKSIRIEYSDVDGDYIFKTLGGDNLRFRWDKEITKHKLKKYGENYLISPIDDSEDVLFYSKNEDAHKTGEALKVVSRDEVTSSKDLENILFTITKSEGDPPMLYTYTKLPEGNLWEKDEKYKSPSGEYEILQRRDGNLVIHSGNPYGTSWESGTGGNPNARAKYYNGHFFMWDVDAKKAVKTITNTGVTRGYHYLALGNDGSLTIRGKLGDLMFTVADTASSAAARVAVEKAVV